MNKLNFLMVAGVLLAGVPCVGVCDDEKTPPAPKVKLTEGTWSDLQKYVAEQKGRVVVVDLWSTSCLPCMTEFPNLVKLRQTYGKKVVCVSFSLDYAGIKSKPPAYYRPRVEKFLTAKKADFRNYLSTVDALEVFDEIKLNSIPAVFVYDTNGKLAKRFDDTLLKPGDEEPFTYEADIVPFVEDLLK